MVFNIINKFNIPFIWTYHLALDGKSWFYIYTCIDSYILLGTPCDQNGNDLPKDSPPPPPDANSILPPLGDWTLLMSLLIRYSPMASYFQLSIVFLTPQILWHIPHWRNLQQHSHNHHWLYPIPITPSAWHHVKDLPYDLWTTLFHFPFLVSFLLPNVSYCGPTDHKSSHHVVGTLPSVFLHMNLVLVWFIVCI